MLHRKTFSRPRRRARASSLETWVRDAPTAGALGGHGCNIAAKPGAASEAASRFSAFRSGDGSPGRARRGWGSDRGCGIRSLEAPAPRMDRSTPQVRGEIRAQSAVGAGFLFRGRAGAVRACTFREESEAYRFSLRAYRHGLDRGGCAREGGGRVVRTRPPPPTRRSSGGSAGSGACPAPRLSRRDAPTGARGPSASAPRFHRSS